MSLHGNTTDRPPVERSQASETVTTERKQTHRLYPSLPNVDSFFRYEVCVPSRSSAEKHNTAAVYHPDSLQDNVQSEASAASSEVRMKAQILILEEQRQELLSINEKWAKEYRTMKEYYRQKVRDLKVLLQQDHEEEISKEGEKDATLYKKIKAKQSTWTGDSDVNSELLKAEEEAKELRAKNSTLTRRWQHQCEEIRRLNKALEEAVLTPQPLEASSETLQEIWKHQAEVYKEDFLKERKDRENLKDKYLELEKKYRKVYNELRVVKSQVTGTRPPQPALECTCTNQAKCPNREDGPVKHQHKQLQRR